MDARELIEDGSGQTQYERKAWELAELLQELRVMLPGVQVLFAFLLTVPFSARFGDVTPLQQQVVFFGTLLCTALSAGCCWRRRFTTGSCGGGRTGRTARGAW